MNMDHTVVGGQDGGGDGGINGDGLRRGWGGEHPTQCTDEVL